jgi:hypothetical protein
MVVMMMVVLGDGVTDHRAANAADHCANRSSDDSAADRASRCATHRSAGRSLGHARHPKRGHSRADNQQTPHLGFSLCRSSPQGVAGGYARRKWRFRKDQRTAVAS